MERTLRSPLILAAPIAIMSGIDLAARNGIIAKSGAAIEQLGEVDVAAFDKTGTLTLGIPKVTAIVLAAHDEPGRGMPDGESQEVSYSRSGEDEDRLLSLAAAVEQLSTHILARAVVEAAQQRSLPLRPVDDFAEIFGKGVHGRVMEEAEEQKEKKVVEVAVGNRTFMQHLGIAVPPLLLSEREQRVERGQMGSFI